jgi:hypothetical protein
VRRPESFRICVVKEISASDKGSRGCWAIVFSFL